MLVRALLAFLSVVPIALVVFHVHQHGVNVPFWDEWENTSDIAIRTSTGELSLRRLTQMHNEHRLLFTNLAAALSTKATRWNLKAEMYLSVALATSMFVVILAVLYRDCPRALPLAIVPISALVFSFRQGFNWVMGMQTNIYFLGFFSVAALWILGRGEPHWMPLVLAAILAACACFTQGAGILVWPTLLIALWLLGYRRWPMLLFWVLAAAACYSVFFAGYPLGGRPFEPGKWLRYAVTFMGNPFFAEVPGISGYARTVAVVGLVVFGLNVAALRAMGQRWRSLATWIALVMLAWGTAFLAAPNRAHMGMRQALSGRYVAQASLFWVALVAVASMVLVHLGRERDHRSRALVLANVVFCCWVSVLYVRANYTSGMPFIALPSHAECLRRFPVTHDATCLRGLHPVFEPDAPHDRMRADIFQRIDALHEQRLSTFADESP